MIRRLLPAVPWVPWVPVGAVVGLLAWIVQGLRPDLGSRHIYLRAGLLVAAMGFSFSFDDPAAPTTDPVPSPLRRRRLLRLMISLIPWTALVAVLIEAGTHGGLQPTLLLDANPSQPQLPIGRLLLEGATMAAAGVAIASIVARRWDQEPGRIASGTLLVLYGAAWIIPERWSPFPLPNELGWTATNPWWSAALVLALTVTVIESWDTRQPARLRPQQERSPTRTQRALTEDATFREPPSPRG